MLLKLAAPLAMGQPRCSAVPVLLLAAFVALPSAAAYGQDGRWSLGIDGLLVSPNGDGAAAGSATGTEDGATYGLDGDGVGVGVGLEFRATRHLGFELELASVDLDVGFRDPVLGAPLTATESASFDIYLAGVRWHAFPDRRLDLSLGGFVAMTKLGDVTFPTAAGGSRKLTFDDDYGFGVAVGVQWRLTRDGGWLLSSDLRYLRTIVESDSGARDLDLDPLLLSVGARYRF